MSAEARRHDNMAPPGVIALAAALVLAVLMLVIGVRSGLLSPAPSAAQLRVETGVAAVRSRQLHFTDQADGTIRIADAQGGATVAVIGQEGSGFIRGVMRGLARERRMHQVGDAPPFELTLWGDGELSLTDTGTGRVIELGGFGKDNRAAFERLLGATHGGLAP